MMKLKTMKAALKAAEISADGTNCVTTVLYDAAWGYDLGLNYVDSRAAVANVLPKRYFSPEAPSIRENARLSRVY